MECFGEGIQKEGRNKLKQPQLQTKIISHKLQRKTSFQGSRTRKLFNEVRLS